MSEAARTDRLRRQVGGDDLRVRPEDTSRRPQPRTASFSCAVSTMRVLQSPAGLRVRRHSDVSGDREWSVARSDVTCVRGRVARYRMFWLTFVLHRLPRIGEQWWPAKSYGRAWVVLRSPGHRGAMSRGMLNLGGGQVSDQYVSFASSARAHLKRTSSLKDWSSTWGTPAPPLRGSAVILGLVRGQSRKVRVEVWGDGWNTAYDAMGKRLPVRCKGELLLTIPFSLRLRCFLSIHQCRRLIELAILLFPGSGAGRCSMSPWSGSNTRTSSPMRRAYSHSARQPWFQE